MKTLLILLLAVGASAEETTQPKAEASKLYQAITATGSPAKIVCPGNADDECTVTWTPKEGATISFSDTKTKRAALITELQAIDDRFDANTDTAADRKRYLKILRILVLRMAKDDL